MIIFKWINLIDLFIQELIKPLLKCRRAFSQGLKLAKVSSRLLNEFAKALLNVLYWIDKKRLSLFKSENENGQWNARYNETPKSRNPQTLKISRNLKKLKFVKFHPNLVFYFVLLFLNIKNGNNKFQS